MATQDVDSWASFFTTVNDVARLICNLITLSVVLVLLFNAIRHRNDSAPPAAEHVDDSKRPHVRAVWCAMDPTSRIVLLTLALYFLANRDMNMIAFILLALTVTLGQNPPQPSHLFRAADHIDDGKHHLLLAATGSVATIKIPNIVTALSHHQNLSIRLLLSPSAAKFLQAQSVEQPSLGTLRAMKNVDGIYLDNDEWRKPWVRGDNILHIELRRWADLMAIVPLSADSMAKIVAGMADSLVLSVVRAWDATGLIDTARPGVSLPYEIGGIRKKGIVVAPAMNTAMWEHPVTRRQVAVLEGEWGVEQGGWFEVLRPVEKNLACGDTGSGAMREWQAIVNVIETRLSLGTARKSFEKN